MFYSNLQCLDEVNNNDLLSQMTYGNEDSVTYSYDELERISSVRYSESISTIDYAYTGMGALGKITDNTSGRSYIYNYDLLGRLTSMTEYSGSKVVQVLTNKVDITPY